MKKSEIFYKLQTLGIHISGLGMILTSEKLKDVELATWNAKVEQHIKELKELQDEVNKIYLKED